MCSVALTWFLHDTSLKISHSHWPVFQAAPDTAREKLMHELQPTKCSEHLKNEFKYRPVSRNPWRTSAQIDDWRTEETLINYVYHTCEIKDRRFLLEQCTDYTNRQCDTAFGCGCSSLWSSTPKNLQLNPLKRHGSVTSRLADNAEDWDADGRLVSPSRWRWRADG